MKIEELQTQADPFTLLEVDDITKEPQATSLKLAEVMGVEHRSVLRAIRRQKERAEDVLSGVLEDTDIPAQYLPFLAKVNPVFTADEYQNEQNGEYYPFYRLNRDACVVTIAQLQGKKAMAWILAYIGAFNMLEEEYVKRRVSSLQRIEIVTEHVLNRRFDKLEKDITSLVKREVQRLK